MVFFSTKSEMILFGLDSRFSNSFQGDLRGFQSLSNPFRYAPEKGSRPHTGKAGSQTPFCTNPRKIPGIFRRVGLFCRRIIGDIFPCKKQGEHGPGPVDPGRTPFFGRSPQSRQSRTEPFDCFINPLPLQNLRVAKPQALARGFPERVPAW